MKYVALMAAWVLAAMSFAQAQNDVGSYNIEKQTTYDQSSASAPALDSEAPHQFSSSISPGTSGALFTSESLTPPTGGTGEVSYFAIGSSGLRFYEDFTTKRRLMRLFQAEPAHTI